MLIILMHIRSKTSKTLLTREKVSSWTRVVLFPEARLPRVYGLEKVAAGYQVKTGPLVSEIAKSLKKIEGRTIFSLVLLTSAYSLPCYVIA